MRGGPINRPLLLAGNLALRLPGVPIGWRRGLASGGSAEVICCCRRSTRRCWHDFSLEWDDGGARFGIDGAAVAAFGPAETPRGPLGFVAWIDNNWTALDADGRYRGGRLAAPGRQWLELARVAIVPGEAR